jgi:hypothetical protein
MSLTRDSIVWPSYVLSEFELVHCIFIGTRPRNEHNNSKQSILYLAQTVPLRFQYIMTD